MNLITLSHLSQEPQSEYKMVTIPLTLPVSLDIKKSRTTARAQDGDTPINAFCLTRHAEVKNHNPSTRW